MLIIERDPRQDAQVGNKILPQLLNIFIATLKSMGSIRNRFALLESAGEAGFVWVLCISLPKQIKLT